MVSWIRDGFLDSRGVPGTSTGHGTEIFGKAWIIRARHGNIWQGTDHKGTAPKSAASLQGGTGVFLTRHGTSESPESSESERL